MKKVSIVIACYNAADRVYACWESLKGQSFGIDNLECIFVDDGSDDGGKTVEKLYEIEKEAPENVIIVLSDSNRGPGSARNLGIDYATGEYLQLLDADDELMPEAIESLYEIAQRHNTDIIQYNHTLILGNQERVNPVSKGNKLCVIDSHEKRIEFLNATTVTYGCTNKFYRLDLIRKAGASFAENVVYEEPKFVYPLFLYTHRIYLCEKGFYRYYLHPDSIVTSKIGKNLLDHPKVQLLTLEDCMKRTELYEEFKDVIACYFLWSYYCETLYFAAERLDSHLPVDYFKEMQNVCKTLFPNWRTNPEIIKVDSFTKNMLETMYTDYETQEQLDAYIVKLRNTQ